MKNQILSDMAFCRQFHSACFEGVYCSARPWRSSH